MSLDLFVACRRAPKLPEDLPDPKRWKVRENGGVVFCELEGAGWLLSINIEPEFDEEVREHWAAQLAYAGDTSISPNNYDVLVSVSLEPTSSSETAEVALAALLDSLKETCGGIEVAN